MRDIGRLLIISGVALAVIGLAITAGLGRLPGDIVIRRGNITFFLPLMTSILLSLVVSLLFWLFRR
jgi:hypothetical protein